MDPEPQQIGELAELDGLERGDLHRRNPSTRRRRSGDRKTSGRQRRQLNSAAMKYTPTRTEWAATAPADAGFDPAKLAEAIQFHQANETPWPRDVLQHLKTGHFEPPPWN